MTTMSLNEFTAIVKNGRFFSATFIKRTTGEVRTMRARCGVKAYLAGGEPAYDFKAKNLLPVYDIEKEGYRSIPLDGLQWVRVRGETLFWNGEVLTTEGGAPALAKDAPELPPAVAAGLHAELAFDDGTGCVLQPQSEEQ